MIILVLEEKAITADEFDTRKTISNKPSNKSKYKYLLEVHDLLPWQIHDDEQQLEFDPPKLDDL